MTSKANSEVRFWYELAERLGTTVAELQSRISSEEFTYWMALWLLRSEEAPKPQPPDAHKKPPRMGFGGRRRKGGR